ncbi:MAG: OmpA family protein [Opitutaceae bacterium]|nr:OmpA family protein [Opitutaceae bacterium]
MNTFAKCLGVSLAIAALSLTACSKKPVRSTPVDTTMGQSAVPTNVSPMPVDTVADQNTQLTPRDPNIIEDANTIRGLLQPVYFDFDRSAVKQSEREKIQNAVKYLQENPDKRMLLEGHCDWRGTAEYNLGLGDRRATAVQRYLETLGIPSSSLEILSKGDLDAVIGGTDAEMAKDRRADFVVLKQGGLPPIATTPAQ